MSDDIVSLIIPIYNAEKYLKKMLDSIVIQTYKKIEVIAVNDCSTDETPKILVEYKQIFLKKGFDYKIVNCKENGGLSNAINCGLNEVSGEYLCFPDADDELSVEYVEAMLSVLKSNTEYKWVRCDYTIINETEKRSWDIVLPDPSVYKNDFFDFVSQLVPHNAWNMMVKRDYFISCTHGNIMNSRLTQEWSLLLPLSYNSNYARCHKKLYKYILRKNNMSSWINGELSSVIKHIEGLYQLNCNVLDMLNISEDIMETLNNVLQIFFSLMKYKVYKKKDLYDLAKKQKEEIYKLIEKDIRKNFILQIDDPDLLVRFTFDKLLGTNSKTITYNKYKEEILRKKYIIIMDDTGRGLYNAVCLAFGNPIQTYENFEIINNKYEKMIKICLIENSTEFENIKKYIGGSENDYIDYRDIRNALREWALNKNI